MHSPNLEDNYPITSLPRLRVAIEGCYPAFAETDLVIRILAILCQFEVVDRWQTHDLLIRGPFSDGNGKRRLVNKALRFQNHVLAAYSPVTLHVSSENPFCVHYQSFEESRCDFGLGHELRIGDQSYFRMPHWWNYVDFASEGIPSPDNWVRLGKPIWQEDLLRPIKWNSAGLRKAVFVTSNLTAERSFLMDRLNRTLQVDGYGRAFDSSIKSHARSSFTKRELLSRYQYSLCPENAISPGYVTEKIPEAYACGCVPIAYADPTCSVDFNRNAIINLHDLLNEGIAEGVQHVLESSERFDRLMDTPLLSATIPSEQLISFVRCVISASR